MEYIDQPLSYRERGVTGLNRCNAAPYAAATKSSFSWDDAIPGSIPSSDEVPDFGMLDYKKIKTVICPRLLQKLKLYEVREMEVEGRLQHVRDSVFIDGERFEHGIIPIGQKYMFRQRDDVWEFRYGLPTLKLDDVSDTAKPLTLAMKWTAKKKVSESRPSVAFQIVTEYGSERTGYDQYDWDRYMVVYEKGTQSPYPFDFDRTQNYI
jgi:hypothetical protein